MLPDRAYAPTAAAINLVVWQVSCTLLCTVHVAYRAGAVPPIDDVGALLESRRATFDDRFERTFGLAAQGYNASEVAFARAALSNLVGGIGYFYGQSLYV